MSYCLNFNCQKPQNSVGIRFCQSCGSNLLLGDRYRTIKPIAQGGFGRTFLAVDEFKPSKPPCAIKQFLPQTQSTNHIQKAAQLFHQEAVRLDELGKHPQIPELLAYITQRERQYLVQEFIDGYSLSQELEDRGRFNETQICQLLNDLLPVLQFVHSKQVIHRDIKPENIIRRTSASPLSPGEIKEKQLVLVDFGAAKFATGTALSRNGTVIGSAGYVAPEQAIGKASFASDIYSLGVTCIQLLTQCHPFDLYDTSVDDWVWRQFLVKNLVSQRLGHIIDKMLKNATNYRYQSAEEVLKDLNIVETQNSVSQQPLVQNVSQIQPATTPNKYNFSPITSLQPETWRCVRSITGHTLWVFSVAFSPDGTILASGNHGNTVKLWQPNTGKLINTLARHSASVSSVAFSPDGVLLASGSVDSTIKLWQADTGKLVGTFIGHFDSVLSVAFSPDGEVLATGSYDNTIKLWQVKTGKLICTLTGHIDLVLSVAFSPNGEVLASASGDTTIKLWQVKTGKLLRTLCGHSNGVLSVAFSHSMGILASGSYDNTIKLWQPESGALIRTLAGNSKSCNSVAFSPDEKILASGNRDKTIQLWQPETGNLISTLAGHSNGILSVAFSPDGQILVSGSQDGTIKVWQCD